MGHHEMVWLSYLSLRWRMKFLAECGRRMHPRAIDAKSAPVPSSPSKLARRTGMTPASQPLGLISDIHGNLAALDAVLAEFGRRAIVDIFVAGDLILGGDAPLEV